jgi:hypothetical protein
MHIERSTTFFSTGAVVGWAARLFILSDDRRFDTIHTLGNDEIQSTG